MTAKLIIVMNHGHDSDHGHSGYIDATSNRRDRSHIDRRNSRSSRRARTNDRDRRSNSRLQMTQAPKKFVC